MRIIVVGSRRFAYKQLVRHVSHRLKLSQSPYAISDLVDLVRRGKLALPEFQRPYVWPPPEVAELLRAVARKWPVGTFLLLRLERRPLFELKPLAGAPPL